MKNISAFILPFLLFSFSSQIYAQKPKNAVHPKKGNKTLVVHKGHGAKQGKVVAVRPHRKHHRRTRVVHYHYRHLPRRGATIATINKSASNIHFRGVSYKVHSGVWYQTNGKNWVVVRTPLGVRLKVLPNGHKKILMGPKTYYYYYGTYYMKKDNEFEVVIPPIGTEIESLPDGYNTVNYQNNEYYEMDGIFYMPSKGDNNEEILIVTEDPSK